MRKKNSSKEEGFLRVHGSEGMATMAGQARQLEQVSLWLQKLAVVAHPVVMTRKHRAEGVTLTGFLQ